MPGFVGARAPGQTIRVRREPLRLPLPLLLLWWLVKLLWRLLLRLAGSPVLLATLSAIVATWAVCQLVSPLPAFAVLLVATAVAIHLRTEHPDLFERWIRLPLMARWRRATIYAHKWPATMDFAGLAKYRKDGAQYLPVLLGVRSTPDVDRVRARMLAGQTVDDWAKVSDRLGQTFGSIDTRVRSVPGHPHEVEIWFLTNDPLLKVIEPLDQDVPVDLSALPVGLREDGEVYRLPLLGNHVLVAGKTGAGKSSVEWAIVHALGPAIADGTVQCWGIDPKAMELGAGDPLFARMAYLDSEDYAVVLEDAVGIMRDRQVTLRGVTRLHSPTPAEPLVVVFIDELAALAYVTERDIKRRIESALGLLLSQGRAVGVSVVGVIQDARKETLPNRGLFTVRACLAVNESDEVELVLDRGARDRGARADKIPANLQGVGFVEVDGIAEPVRVRFCYVTDADIAGLTGGWLPPSLEVIPRGITLPEIDDAA